ncbi:hypothetical protein C8R46DRAFT_1220333 [Mycena filopes]|nr:hypothetical protein C8R46DRAFT_1220333 [Mycena filopes]
MVNIAVHISSTTYFLSYFLLHPHYLMSVSDGPVQPSRRTLDAAEIWHRSASRLKAKHLKAKAELAGLLDRLQHTDKKLAVHEAQTKSIASKKDDDVEIAVTCGICLQPLINPDITIECAHTFCQRCLVEALKSAVDAVVKSGIVERDRRTIIPPRDHSAYDAVFGSPSPWRRQRPSPRASNYGAARNDSSSRRRDRWNSRSTVTSGRTGSSASSPWDHWNDNGNTIGWGVARDTPSMGTMGFYDPRTGILREW